MTEHGILMYDLAGNWCEECGRAKSYRLWPGVLTGCKTCDEVVTRHRCIDTRPGPDGFDAGDRWTCPGCGTVWAVTEEGAWCDECGCHECRTEKRWTVSVRGDRIDTAPRRDPRPYAPFRSLFPLPAARVTRPGPFGECYKTASGMTVHVRPGCRCRR